MKSSKGFSAGISGRQYSSSLTAGSKRDYASAEIRLVLPGVALYLRVVRRWSLVCLLSLALAFAYTHRTNISFTLADPQFIAFLRLSDTDRGTLNSAFFWTYGLLQIPSGSLVDRFGPKWPLAVGVFCWCLFSASTGLVNTFWAVLALRLLLGLGESIITPAGLRWIRDHMEERRRGLATGIFFSGSKYGPALAAPIAAWLIK